jgi:hypothetical protein
MTGWGINGIHTIAKYAPLIPKELLSDSIGDQEWEINITHDLAMIGKLMEY